MDGTMTPSMLPTSTVTVSADSLRVSVQYAQMLKTFNSFSSEVL